MERKNVKKSIELFNIKCKIRELNMNREMYINLINELQTNPDYEQYSKNDVEKYLKQYKEDLKQVEQDIKEFQHYELEQDINFYKI